MDMKIIGEQIRQHRKVKGLTQEELAKASDLSTMSIRRYESGDRIAPQEALTKIAKALGVHLRDLANTSMWEEFDKRFDTEALVKEVKKIEAIQSYLEELGYIVKLSSIPLESHEEEIIDEDGEIIGVATVVDKEIPQYHIVGNGLSVTLSETDFMRLKTSSADLINSFLWQKSQERK